MAARANWKGHLKLSLVSCAVALFPATSARERVSFHLVNRETKHRLKQQYVDSVSGDIVERDERARGYEVSKGDYLLIDESDIDHIALESTHTIDIERFVPRDSVDDVFLDSAYYLAPDDKVGQEAYAVIREAMRARNVAGLARVVLYGRERIVLIEPRDAGLLGTTLHYDYEVRKSDSVFDGIPTTKVAQDLLELASHIIDTKQGAFEPSEFKDRYEDAVVAMIRAKRAGRPAPALKAPEPSGNVVSLMDALKRSLDPGKESGKTAKDSAKTEKTKGQATKTSAAPAPHGRRAPKAAARPRRKAG